MKVIAAADVKVPREGAPRKYICHEEGAVTVPDTHYYRLRIREGDLIEVIATQVAASAAEPSQPEAEHPEQADTRSA